MATNADNSRLLQSALEYAGYGWRVLPIKPASKLPIIKAWQINASINPAQIESWWTQWPTANVGVCLGEGSNLIDVECDSDKAEQQLASLFDGAIPLTATYRGQRGKHRLFRWQSDLPGGAVIKLGDIEVRTGNGGKGAQSVFPPSIHPSGDAYQWVVPPSESMPIALPDAILARLWNLTDDDLAPPSSGGMQHTAAERAALYVETIEGCAEGGRNQRGYKVACVLLRDFAISVADAWPILSAWNQKNNPPLGEVELRHCATSAEKYGLGVVGSKLDGNTPTKPRRKKAWEPQTPAENNTELTNDFVFTPVEREPDISAYCYSLIHGQKELAQRDAAMNIFKAVEAVNACRVHPLSDDELKAVFTLHLKAERGRRMNERAEMLMNPPPEAVAESAASGSDEKKQNVWRLTIIHSDPPRYQLFSPLFRKVEFIVLDAKQMNSPGSIRIEALAQAECALPKAFDELWSKPRKGEPCLYETLVQTAEHKSAPLEEQRHLVVADCLRDKLSKARIVEEGKDPDPRGRPCLMPDGSVVFKFNMVWEEMWQGPHRIEKGELSKLLQSLNAAWRWYGGASGGKRPRFKCLPRESLARLDKMLEEATGIEVV